MKRFLFISCIAAAVSLNGAVSFLGYLSPSGGQQGKTVRVIAGGQRINGRVTILCSNPGVKLKSAVNIPYMGYFQPPQRKWLTQYIKNLYSGTMEKPPVPEDKEGHVWRKHAWLDDPGKLPLLERSLVANALFVRANPLQAAPSIASRVLLELEIAPDAPVGPCRIRLVTGRNISNEKLFFVDSAREFHELPYYPPFAKKPEMAPVSTFPAVLNGTVMPGETDCFPVFLEKGKEYSFSMYAAELSPYLGDTVPGHFQGVLLLRGPDGKETAFADDEYHHPDPVLRFTAKETGIHTLHVSDSLKRGRADFVYRVTVTEGIVPFRPYKNVSGYSRSGTVISAETVPAVITSEHWKKGLDIKGEIRQVKGVTFTLSAKKGERLIAEVFAARLDSPLDSVLVLRGKTKNFYRKNDDFSQNWDLDLCRRQTDSKLDITFPADGIYTLQLQSRNTPGEKDHFYLLQFRQPTPSVMAVSGGSVLDLNRSGVGKMRFYVQRKDGFKGNITITSPRLKALGNAIIPAEKNSAEIYFCFRDPKQKNQVVSLTFQAEYMVNGKKKITQVIPADETMQAFAYTHLLTAERFYCYGMRFRKQKLKK